MSWRQELAKLGALFRGRKRAEDLEDEIRAHLRIEEQENLESGMPPDEAHYAALRRFGNVALARERSRDMWTWQTIETLGQDFRFGLRMLLKNPGFTAVAVIMLALGIGANTAIFSVVNAVLLRPLPYPDSDRIATLTNPPTTDKAITALHARLVSIPDFQDWHDQSSSFEAMAYYHGGEAAVTVGSAAEYAQVARVSPEFFRVFGVEPVLGRLFTAEEARAGGSGALVISYDYWQSHFGGDTKALGQTVGGLGKPLPIVGVLPATFRFLDKTDLWYPMNTVFREPTANFRGGRNYFAVARLKSGVSLEQAQSEITLIGRRLEREYPDFDKGRTVAVTRLRDEMAGEVRLTLYLLLGAVGVVLLIACANTATLLLGKATARSREVAVRAALGASRNRLVRQWVTESLLLALSAGGLGLLLAYWGSKALVALAPRELPRLSEISLDRRILAFTLATSMITSLLFGLIPAFHAARVDLSESLKQGGRRVVSGAGMVRVRGVLVVVEVALAVVLLSAAGLLLRSFEALQNVDMGYRPEKVLTMKATVPAPTPVARQFFGDILPQIRDLPGVLSAGATMALPGQVESMATGPYFFDHLPPQKDWPAAPGAVVSVVAPGTFRALGIPMQRGRDFNDGDGSGKPLVAVVNEALVRKSLPGRNPVGRTVYCLFDSAQPMTIIGVTGDVRERGQAHEPMPECYIPYLQHEFNGETLSIVVRTAGDPSGLEETLRRLANKTSPTVPMKFMPMETMLSEEMATPRFRTLLFSLFAGLAVCLATTGIYGVMSYTSGLRSNEFGLRMALGASRGSVLRLVLRQALMLVSIGVGIGLAFALGVSRLLTCALFEVKPTDPLTFIAVSLNLIVVALVASYVPARRATKVDPMVALRHE
ncbi:MAG TPA: ABC transporter permease [Terriglobia bacterium]|nr:ABC transporter permease [Terriglobia bacterium]